MKQLFMIILAMGIAPVVGAVEIFCGVRASPGPTKPELVFDVTYDIDENRHKLNMMNIPIHSWYLSIPVLITIEDVKDYFSPHDSDAVNMQFSKSAMIDGKLIEAKGEVVYWGSEYLFRTLHT